jgi:hypothetical protein
VNRAAVVCLCLAVGGCSDLSISSTTTSHEVAPPHAPRQFARRADRSAVQAIRRFATAYINWDAATVVADLQKLAGQSIGQARSVLQLAAADTAQDYELRRGGVANRGQVEAIAPLPEPPNRYVVVTLERTTATNSGAYQGLRPAWHVALATVTALSRGHWVLSGWQPES